MKRLSDGIAKIHARVATWVSLLWFYVRSHALFMRVVAVTLAILMAAAFFAGGYFYSQRHFDRLMAGFERVSERYQLPYEGVSWEARFSALQRYIEVADEAADEIKRYLYEKDQKINELEEQLYFYRTVIAPEDEKKDLTVFSVRLRQGEQAQTYSVQVVLRNHRSKKGAVKGRVRVLVEGEFAPQGVVAVRDDLLVDKISFSFKYFQRLQGVLRLPEDFSPDRLSVVVDSNKYGDIEETYSWEALLNADE